jgi:glycerophosphoryl diester phosphodiesterase
MQFPEHTSESYLAALSQGAGIVECDVAVTKDGELVCRHAQCDLHTTTDIVGRPELNAKCTTPFVAGSGTAPKCCTSDITLKEFKMLCGKMDAANKNGATAKEYMDGTASWRTDLYSTCARVVTHAESIDLIKKHGGKFTPELKAYDQKEGMIAYDEVRAKIVREYVKANVDSSQVWLQSFVLEDIQYWVKNYATTFGPQAVYLDNDYSGKLKGMTFANLTKQGVKYYAPPMWMLVEQHGSKYAASDLALNAKAVGLKLITWTLERSGHLASGGGWYYQSAKNITNNDGDMFELLHVLIKDVGVKGVFSDWPATVTFYANCIMDPKHTAKTCGEVKEAYMKEQCCGQPMKPFQSLMLPRPVVR